MIPHPGESTAFDVTLSSLLQGGSTFGAVGRIARAPVSAAGDGLIVAGRYTCHDLVGRGGMGEVWRATDAIGGGQVALKLVPALAPAEQEQVRRELAALRWLRLPGVVQLLDDGRLDTPDGERRFIVMELVEGEPFLDRRTRWSQVAAPVLVLLENLARVHFAGVVHRDLKPANIRCDAAGNPVLLDFGVARGAAIGGGTVGVEGTPFTMAPEVRAGLPCDARADLYAIGVMLYWALSGKTPHDGTREGILHGVRPPLATVAPHVPAHVAAVVDALVSIDPGARPATALEVLEALGGHPPPAVAPAEDAADWRALRPLFHGEDGFLHVQEDAAALLWERTGGARDRVARELAAWIRAGLAHWIGEQIKTDRAAVERLRAGLRLGGPPDLAGLTAEAAELYRRLQIAWPDGPPEPGAAWDELRGRGLVWALPDGRAGVDPYVRPADDAADHLRLASGLPAGEARLRHLIAGGADAREVADEALRVAEALRDESQVERSTAIADLGLAAARRAGDAAREEALLVERVVGLNEHRSATARERARYEIERSTLRTPVVVAMGALMDALVHVRGSDPERGASALRSLAPFAHPELEAWRQIGRLAAVRRTGSVADHEALVEELEDWARVDPARRNGRHLMWKGILRYRQRRYADAAELHRRAAEWAGASPRLRVGARIEAAWAWVDALEFDEAVAEAERAQGQTLRLTGDDECRRVAVERLAGYRRGALLICRPELVDAGAQVGLYWEALYASIEAAVAWRAGSLPLGAALAERAHGAWERYGSEDSAVLSAAVACACRAPADPSEAVALASRAVRIDPEFAIQVYGLLARADATHRDEWVARARPLATVRPPHQYGLRLDVLSIAECLEVPP